MKLKFSFYLIGLFYFLFSPIVFGEPKSLKSKNLEISLLKNKNSLYNHYLQNQIEHDSFIDFYISEKGILNSETIYNYDLCKSRMSPDQLESCLNQFLEDNQDSFLSPSIKNIFFESLNDLKDFKSANAILDTSTLKKINTGSQISLASILDFNLYEDDRLFLNGTLLTSSELKNIYLPQDLKFHFLCLSQRYEPISYFGKPQKLDFSRIPFENFREATPIAELPTKSPEVSFYQKPLFWVGAAVGSFIVYSMTKDFLNKNEVSIEFQF